MKVVALAGGTGSAKLLRGFQALPVDLTAVVNVGDNVWMYGVYVCPDLDIATYTLAGVSHPGRGWGIKGDTFEVLSSLSRLGSEDWFRLGDRDLATCLLRTQIMRAGGTLTEATDAIRRGFGVKTEVLPATDSPVETWVSTSKGDVHLQEFWVKKGGRPSVRGVSYRGAEGASPTSRVRAAILGADRVIVCPANPVTSIGPILAIDGFRSLLSRTRARVVALSPMSGAAPFSGPAGKLLRAVGKRPDSLGVAELYSGFLDSMLISEADAPLVSSVASLGVECSVSDTLMKGRGDEVRLSKELLEL